MLLGDLVSELLAHTQVYLRFTCCLSQGLSTAKHTSSRSGATTALQDNEISGNTVGIWRIRSPKELGFTGNM